MPVNNRLKSLPRNEMRAGLWAKWELQERTSPIPWNSTTCCCFIFSIITEDSYTSHYHSILYPNVSSEALSSVPSVRNVLLLGDIQWTKHILFKCWELCSLLFLSAPYKIVSSVLQRRRRLATKLRRNNTTSAVGTEIVYGHCKWIFVSNASLPFMKFSPTI